MADIRAFRYSRGSPLPPPCAPFAPPQTPPNTQAVLAPSQSIGAVATRAIVLLGWRACQSAMVRAATRCCRRSRPISASRSGGVDRGVDLCGDATARCSSSAGLVGDRLGQYRMIAIATALCAVLTFVCGLTSCSRADGRRLATA